MGSSRYIYCGHTVGWRPLDSYQCQTHLCEVLQINSPVNYEVSTRSVRSVIRTLPCPTYFPPNSVCIRPVRCNVSYSHELDRICLVPSLGTEELHLLLASRNSPPEFAQRMELVKKTHCISGIGCKFLPSTVSSNWNRSRVMGCLEMLLPDCYKLLAWVVGNVLVDPQVQSYVVGVVGESLTGKSTVLRYLRVLFEGAVSNLSPELITGQQAVSYERLHVEQ